MDGVMYGFEKRAWKALCDDYSMMLYSMFGLDLDIQTHFYA